MNSNEPKYSKIWNKNFEAIQEYVRLGLPVIPCIPNEKIPLITGWANRRRTTHDDVQRWHDEFRCFNIGLVMGGSSGIVGLDVDSHVALEKLGEISKGDLPITWSFDTPSGGVRHLYEIPEGIVVKKKLLYEGEGKHSEILLLGDGCQTIMPPSINAVGKFYRWHKGSNPGCCKPAVMPNWLIERVCTTSKTTHQVKSKVLSRINDCMTEQDPLVIYVSDIDRRCPSAPLELLEMRCPLFRSDLQEQMTSGVHEHAWYRWVQVLVSSGCLEAALSFSRLSEKHTQHSEKRIEKLFHSGIGGMTRCITFGCSEGQVAKCFGVARYNSPDGLVSNSPGSHLVIGRSSK